MTAAKLGRTMSDSRPGSFYTLRYVAGTPLSDRAHSATTSRWPTWVDADDHRATLPQTDLLEVVTRGGEHQ